jgi:hypothetical protein
MKAGILLAKSYREVAHAYIVRSDCFRNVDMLKVARTKTLESRDVETKVGMAMMNQRRA